MPFVNLANLRPRHFYKAKAMKSKSSDVNDDEAVSAAKVQDLKPELQDLVNTAIIGEEISSAESVLANLQTVPITSAGVKAPRVPLYYHIQSNIIRPVELKTLRRAVVKSIRTPAHKTVQPQPVPERPAPADTALDLHDGDVVQLRPHRTLANAAAAPVSQKVRRQRALKLLARLRRFSKRTRNKVDAIASQLRHKPTRAELINAESRLGSTIFGPIPAGHRREFFHDRENVWIWHEDWHDDGRHEHIMTIRYEVRPSGVYKKLSAGHYVKLVGAELENFRQATHVYLYLIKQKLYRHAA